MTGHGDVPLAVQAMEKGAVTFLEKPFQDQALEAALERVFNSNQYSPVPPATQTEPAADLPSFEYQHRIASLTRREKEIFTHVLTGNTSKIIARELGVTHKNVEHFRSKIMKKMKADSLAHLIRMEMNKRVC
jgi:two-component system response regulator FixJ